MTVCPFENSIYNSLFLNSLKLKFNLCATKGTAEYIQKHGMKCKTINKVSSGSPHIVDVLDSKKIALVIIQCIEENGLLQIDLDEIEATHFLQGTG